MTGAGSTTATTTWRTIRAPGRTSPSAPGWWPGNGSLTGSSWRGCARRCRASSMERARLLPAGVPMPAPPGSDHSPAAGKNPGSDAERKSEAWTVHMRAVPNQAPLFLYRNCWYRLVCGIFFVTYGDSFIPQKRVLLWSEAHQKITRRTHV